MCCAFYFSSARHYERGLPSAASALTRPRLSPSLRSVVAAVVCFLSARLPAADLRILFSARTGVSDPFNLYSMRPDGTNLVQHTTTSTVSEWAAALSPDGSRLAFVDPSLSSNNLRVMSVDGGTPVTVPISGKANAVQWIDSQTLAYGRQNGATTTQYFLYRITSTGIDTAIYANTFRSFFTGVDSFQIHRSSGRLYFGASTSTSSNGPVTPQSGLLSAASPDLIFTRGADALVAGESGTQGTTLVDHYDPIVSPDGTKIAYCADHGTGYHKLYVRNNAPADTASQVRVSDQFCGDPDWAPDGSWLAFTRSTTSTFGASAYLGNIHRVNPDGTSLQNLTGSLGSIAGKSAHPLIYDADLVNKPFQLLASRNSVTGEITLAWPVKPGLSYRLLYSDDFTSWNDTLPNSLKVAGAFDFILTYVDVPTGVPRRFYKVQSE